MTDDHHQGSFWSSPRRILGTTNAREIGYLYFVMAFINAAIAGLYAIIMRTELWTPEGGNVFSDPIKGAENYNSMFTQHGAGMIFLVIIPLGAGMGNFLIPRMVSSINNDMYWSKWNNVAFWMVPIGSLLFWLSLAPIGWTAYPPVSVVEAAGGIDTWIISLVILGMSSTIGAINFILTIWKGRDPKLGWMDLDLFVWGTLLTSVLLLLTTPSVVIALVMVFFDRNLHSSFFWSPQAGGATAPVLYQHLFWFFAHPEVYVMVMPAFGLISVLIAKFSRNKIFGYTGMVAAFLALTVLSFLVWAHHMYVTGLNPWVRIAFTTMTFVIAIPSGIKVFNWLTTLWGGNIKLDVPMLFALSFLIMFTLGGITGVYANIVPIDLLLHDTYWVVGHFHFVVAAGSLQAFFGAIYYYFPDLTGGKMYPKRLAQGHFWLWSIGNFLSFMAFTLLGYEGMPRRYFAYPAEFAGLHKVATIGAFMMGISFILFLLALFIGWRGNETVDMDDPFELGSGYDFPKPFADRIEEETGEKITVEHETSLWLPAAAAAITFPFIGFMGMLNTGIFSLDFFSEMSEGTIKAFGYFFILLFIVFVAAFYRNESSKEKSPSMIDKYKTSRTWEMWVILASETVFFGILIGVGIAMRRNATQWPDPGEELDVILTAINTFVLICSSFTMAKAVQAAKRDQQDKLWKFLGATIILGTIFISVQIFEYIELMNHGKIALIEEGAEFMNFSSAFFIQTGFHGFHVLLGIGLLIFVFFRARNGGYTKENHEYVEYVGLYWHFVDLVWIMLFTIVYLI